MDKQESRSTLKTAAIAAAIIMFCMFGACATCMGAAGTAAVEATEKREAQKKQAEADLQQQLAACAQSEATPWSSWGAASDSRLTSFTASHRTLGRPCPSARVRPSQYGEAVDESSPAT